MEELLKLAASKGYTSLFTTAIHDLCNTIEQATKDMNGFDHAEVVDNRIDKVREKLFMHSDLIELSLIQRWLRDTQKVSDQLLKNEPTLKGGTNIKVTVQPESLKLYSYLVIFGTGQHDYLIDSEKDYSTYEEALMNGIHEALKLI